MNERVEWREVAEQLEAEVEQLRRQILGLAEVLPPEYLGYLDSPFDRAVGMLDALDGWNETAMEKSDVITTLEALWRRLT
jgi:hypothetical protein